MASPNAVFTELVSTTFRKHRKEIVDNVSKNNALLRRIYDKGQVRKEDGGLTITAPLDYAENGTYQRYSGYDVLNIGGFSDQVFDQIADFAAGRMGPDHWVGQIRAVDV